MECFNQISLPLLIHQRQNLMFLFRELNSQSHQSLPYLSSAQPNYLQIPPYIQTEHFVQTFSPFQLPVLWPIRLWTSFNQQSLTSPLHLHQPKQACLVLIEFGATSNWPNLCCLTSSEFTVFATIILALSVIATKIH
jgi:hypothetical protein